MGGKMNQLRSTGVLYIDKRLIRQGLDPNSLVIFSYIESRSIAGRFSKSVYEISRATNTSPMTVKRAIKRLTEEQIISLEGNTVNRTIQIL